MPRTCADDQVIICKPRLAEPDLAQRWINPRHFTQQHAHVGLDAEHFAERCCDICRRQRCSRDLVEQRLERLHEHDPRSRRIERAKLTRETTPS
jgi:hypothetical protein